MSQHGGGAEVSTSTFIVAIFVCSAVVAPQVLWAIFSFRQAATKGRRALWVLNVVAVGIEVLVYLVLIANFVFFASLSGAFPGN